MRHLRIERSFRRGLQSYHQSATVQAQIAKVLAGELAKHAPKELNTAFEFGCGTGHLTRALRAQFDIGTLDLNDLVPDCADITGPLGDRFLPGPIEALPLPRDPDLIASASTIQWVEDPRALMRRLWQSLRPGGWLAVSGFASDHFPELQAMGSEAAAPSYISARDWGAMLPPEARICLREETRIEMRFNSALDLLRHLRATGVNGKAQGGWSPARLRSFSDTYRERFGRNGQLPLTYVPTFLIAQKPG